MSNITYLKWEPAMSIEEDYYEEGLINDYSVPVFSPITASGSVSRNFEVMPANSYYGDTPEVKMSKYKDVSNLSPETLLEMLDKGFITNDQIHPVHFKKIMDYLKTGPKASNILNVSSKRKLDLD